MIRTCDLWWLPIYILAILVIIILSIAWAAFWCIDEMWGREHKLPKFSEALYKPWKDMTNP